MNKTDEPQKHAVPFGVHGPREALLLTTPSGVNRASYETGFPPITMILKEEGGKPPKGPDMNQILYELASVARWSGAGGSYRFDSAFSNAVAGYPAGARILASDGSGFWLNTTEGNTTPPENDTAALTGWIPDGNFGLTMITGLSNSNLVLTTLQAAKETLILTGNLTANITITVPAWVKKWTVFNHCTGDFSVTLKTINGKGVVVSPLSSMLLWGDGSQLFTPIPPPTRSLIAPGGLLAIKVLSGTGNYTPSAGTKKIRVKAQGGGGAGGSTAVTESGEIAAGGGGTAGAYGETTFIEATGLSAVKFSVGQGGASEGTWTRGEFGGASIFGEYITAPGGRGGYPGPASSDHPVVASSDPPSNPCTGTALLFSCPGQGGKGPLILDPVDNRILGGQGGASFFGGGGWDLNAAEIFRYYWLDGAPATIIGAGGAGAASITNSKKSYQGRANGVGGGVGADGLLIIEEYT